ncbi:Ribokinase-like protein [Cladochytrium replicatum]|nr:Ribokinase-like protein [Cladochytrium replicatum]
MDPHELTVFVVGALYLDVILHVDSFPPQDSKLRAKAVEKRRGGNSGNTVEVLSQYTEGVRNRITGRNIGLSVEFVGSLTGNPPGGAGSADEPSVSPLVSNLANLPGVSLLWSVFRGSAHSEDPTSWIISTTDPASRTIINYNPCPDLTAEEFATQMGPALDGRRIATTNPIGDMTSPISKEESHASTWIHFEGRNTKETIRMIEFLDAFYLHDGSARRKSFSSRTPTGNPVLSASTPPSVAVSPSLSGEGDWELRNLMLSIEFEKVERTAEGIEEILPYADVCFFSKTYVEGNGFPGAPTGFLDNVRRRCKKGALLVVTWGDQGAFGLVNNPNRPAKTFHCTGIPLASNEIKDTIGAGDTFIAGMIVALGAMSLSPIEATTYACRLASAKCAQQGFANVLRSAHLP